MSTLSPPPRSELLREVASMLLDDEIDGPLAVALADYTDCGPIDLSVRALPAVDPISSLFGFRAPDEWVAFGVVTGATARHLDAPAHAPIRVRVVHLLDRRGIEVSIAKTGEGSSPMLVDFCGAPSVFGRIPDACRRVLGLPTVPPATGPQLLWALDWLDRVLAAVLDRDLGAPPLEWPAIYQLRRGRPSIDAPWSILRRECAAGQLDVGQVSARDAEWMDDGMFSRQVVAAYPELLDLLIDLAELLPGDIVRNIIDRLDVDHAR